MLAGRRRREDAPAEETRESAKLLNPLIRPVDARATCAPVPPQGAIMYTELTRWFEHRTCSATQARKIRTPLISLKN